MKGFINKAELERAYRAISACPCCGSSEDVHTCGCSPEVFSRPRPDKIEVEVEPLLGATSTVETFEGARYSSRSRKQETEIRPCVCTPQNCTSPHCVNRKERFCKACFGECLYDVPDKPGELEKLGELPWDVLNIQGLEKGHEVANSQAKTLNTMVEKINEIIKALNYLLKEREER